MERIKRIWSFLSRELVVALFLGAIPAALIYFISDIDSALSVATAPPKIAAIWWTLLLGLCCVDVSRSSRIMTQVVMIVQPAVLGLLRVTAGVLFFAFMLSIILGAIEANWKGLETALFCAVAFFAFEGMIGICLIKFEMNHAESA